MTAALRQEDSVTEIPCGDVESGGLTLRGFELVPPEATCRSATARPAGLI